MKEVAGFDIRFSELDDLAYLSSWLSRPHACDDFPFTDTEKDEALKNWIGFSKYKASLTGVLEGNIPCAIGTLFLMPYRKVAHHASFYLVVDPEHRRRGIGTSMIKNLLHLARARFRLESLHVELFLPSPLEKLLRDTFHFQPFAKQEDYLNMGTQMRPRLLMEYFYG